jgi:hypothetical protein
VVVGGERVGAAQTEDVADQRRAMVALDLLVLHDTQTGVKVTDGRTVCWVPRRAVELEQIERRLYEVKMSERLAAEKGLI